MDRRGNRPSVAARCAVVLVAVLAGGCGESSPSQPAEPRRSAAVVTAVDTEAFQAAEATVRAFFAVKGHAADPISVMIDVQAAYLTSRDVHPTTAYEDGWGDLPSGITDTDVSVELTDMRRVGDEILVDFASERTSVSYPVHGTELQLDQGQPGDGYWDGTATLEERDGVWLINDLTIDSYGGSLG